MEPLWAGTRGHMPLGWIGSRVMTTQGPGLKMELMACASVQSGSTKETHVKVEGHLGGNYRPFRLLMPCGWSKPLSLGASTPCDDSNRINALILLQARNQTQG